MTLDEKSKAYCEDRHRSWVRSESSTDRALWLLDALHKDDSEARCAARIHASLGNSGVDIEGITKVFGTRVGNLLRGMSRLAVVAGEQSSASKESRIHSAAPEVQNILLACEIVDIQDELTSYGRIRALPKLRALQRRLPLFKNASAGLIDLADQLLELELD